MAMMGMKRNYDDIDPDYEDASNQNLKRQKLLQLDAKESTVRKIESIIQKHFSIEIHNKEAEIDLLDQGLHEARAVLDRLRACIIASYYSKAGHLGQAKLNPGQTAIIHPAVKKHIGKTVPSGEYNPAPGECQRNQENLDTKICDTVEQKLPQAPSSANIHGETQGQTDAPPGGENHNQIHQHNVPEKSSSKTRDEVTQNKTSRYRKVKKQIVVGNVSKYIPPDKRDDNDQATHKWMVYVRGHRDEPQICHFVSKVWFFLHPSYRPNDLVEISEPPFHLTRRGWGEFPVRIQLHFADRRNKRVDIIHHLKLDKTYTGLQTLGSETHVDIELDTASVLERAESPFSEVPTSVSSLPLKQDTPQSFSTQNSNLSTLTSLDSSSNLDQPLPSTALPTNPGQPTINVSHPVSILTSPKERIAVKSEQLDSFESAKDGFPSVDIKQETADSENSLGVIWSHDQAGVLSQEQGIMGSGDVLLSSGAFKDLQKIASTPTVLKPPAPPPVTSRPSPSPRSRTPSKLQISRSLTPQGWTRLQIKQEDPQIKEEPVDDGYPRPSSRLSASSDGHTHQTPTKVSATSDSCFRPFSADPSSSGWTHVQIKSEPVTPDRPASSCSGRTDRFSMPTTPDKSESQSSIPSSPATPDRMVRFELGRNMSPGLKLNVADTKNLLSLQRQGAAVGSDDQGGVYSALDTSLDSTPDFSSWKQSQTLVTSKQSVTLGLGLAALSTAAQKSSDQRAAKSANVKSDVNQEVAITQSPDTTPGASRSGVPKPGISTIRSVVSQVSPSQAPKQIAHQDTVYVQCMDASGKVYLIPQQMIKSPGNQILPKPENVNSPSVIPAVSPKVVPHTTIVGCGANKATLTYRMAHPNPMTTLTRVQGPMSSLATRAHTPLATRPQTSVLSRAPGPTSQLLSKAPQGQKVIVLPSSSSNPRQMVVTGPPKIAQPALSPQSMILRDPSGKMQVVQMITPGISPTSGVRKAMPLSGAKLTSPDKSVLRFSTPPRQSVLIPRQSGVPVRSGQLLQVQRPLKPAALSQDNQKLLTAESVSTKPTIPDPLISQSKSIDPSSKGMNVSHTPSGSIASNKEAKSVGNTTGNSLMVLASIAPMDSDEQVSRITSASDPVVTTETKPVLGVTSVKATTPKLPSKTQQVPVNKPQGVSLIRPGLIPSRALAATTPVLPGSTIKLSLDMRPQSLTRSASADQIPSLQAATATKQIRPTTQNTKPVFLSTKIGNQTVLLKLQQPAAQNSGNLDPTNASSSIAIPTHGISAPVLTLPTSDRAQIKSDLIHGNEIVSDKSMLTKALFEQTIKHGQILGLGRTKERKEVQIEINLPGFANCEELVCYLARRYPLVCPDVDRQLHPYCAHSEGIFLSWNIGKRRAAEWQRACRIRKKILSSLSGEIIFHGSPIWSTKQIMIWCRQHFYTPLYKENSGDLHKVLASPTRGHYNSYSDHTTALSRLSEISHTPGGNTEQDEEIDIVSVQEKSSNNKLLSESEANGQITDLETDGYQEGDPLILSATSHIVAPSVSTQFVQEVAAQVGIQFSPVKVALDDGSDVSMPLTADILATAVKFFVNTIVRKSAAVQFTDKRFPDQISADDVHRAIQQLPKCDFLLNTHLGKPLQSSNYSTVTPSGD